MPLIMKAHLATCALSAVLLAGAIGSGGAQAFAVKDQTRLPGLEDGAQSGTSDTPLGPLAPLAPEREEEAMPPQGGGGQLKPVEPHSHEEQGGEPIGMVAPEQVELTEDSAKRSVDAFIKLKENYQDTDIAEYETLEQFVAEAKEGPALEADIKSFGFETVGDWNNTIISVSFAYAAVASAQEDEINQELENIRADTTLDEETKASLIESLKSMLPSEANKAVVKKLNEDPAWAAKLKLLADDEQGGSEQ